MTRYDTYEWWYFFIFTHTYVYIYISSSNMVKTFPIHSLHNFTPEVLCPHPSGLVMTTWTPPLWIGCRSGRARWSLAFSISFGQLKSMRREENRRNMKRERSTAQLAVVVECCRSLDIMRISNEMVRRILSFHVYPVVWRELRSYRQL